MLEEVCCEQGGHKGLEKTSAPVCSKLDGTGPLGGGARRLGLCRVGCCCFLNFILFDIIIARMSVV